MYWVDGLIFCVCMSGAAIGICEVDGYLWKVKWICGGRCFLVFSDANGCVRGFCCEQSFYYAGGVWVSEVS